MNKYSAIIATLIMITSYGVANADNNPSIAPDCDELEKYIGPENLKTSNFDLAGYKVSVCHDKKDDVKAQIGQLLEDEVDSFKERLNDETTEIQGKLTIHYYPTKELWDRALDDSGFEAPCELIAGYESGLDELYLLSKVAVNDLNCTSPVNFEDHLSKEFQAALEKFNLPLEDLCAFKYPGYSQININTNSNAIPVCYSDNDLSDLSPFISPAYGEPSVSKSIKKIHEFFHANENEFSFNDFHIYFPHTLREFRDAAAPFNDCYVIGLVPGNSAVFAPPALYDGTDICHTYDESDYEELITHELIHLFNKSNSPNTLTNNENNWLWEGVATYASEQYEPYYLEYTNSTCFSEVLNQEITTPISGFEDMSAPKCAYSLAPTFFDFAEETYGRSFIIDLVMRTESTVEIEALFLNNASYTTLDELFAAFNVWLLNHPSF